MIDIGKYKPMDCPVCGDFHFAELDETDVEIYDYMQCPICGWKFDLEQVEEPTLQNRTNELSLLEYKAQYEEKKLNCPDYNYRDETYKPTPHECPVCHDFEFNDVGDYSVCPNCGWINDLLMESEPDSWEGSSNEFCLNDFRKNYKSMKEKKMNYKYSKDGFIKE